MYDDRDEALRDGLMLAKRDGIQVIWCEQRGWGFAWFIASYPAVMREQAIGVRYILPNGEVCKLS